MSRLPLVDPSHAQGKTHDLFTAVKSQMGRVPNLMKAMANSPAVLEGYLGFSKSWPTARSTPSFGSGSPSRWPSPMAVATAWRLTTSWASSLVSTRRSARRIAVGIRTTPR